MKPTLLTLGLASLLATAPGLAIAQTGIAPSKSAPPELLAAAPAWAGDQQQYWGTIPPPRPLPYGYTWNDYRGAEIEHPLYAPRHHGHVHHTGGATCLMSSLCCWFDRLFARPCPSYPSASYEGHVSTELPPLPTLVSPPQPGSMTQPSTPLERPFAEKSFAEPAPIRVPAKPLVTTPPMPKTQSRPLEPAPIDPAPVLPPVDLIPTRPLVSQPAAEPVPSDPKPIAPTPIAPSPALPSVAVPSPAVPGPTVPNIPVPSFSLPSLEDRQPLASDRPPVVELAPEFVVPQEPDTVSPPQNIIPPAIVIPRNVIPQKLVPLNIVPIR